MKHYPADGMTVAEARMRRRRRAIRAAAGEPHLVLEYDIDTRLLTVSLTGLGQETKVAQTLDTVLVTGKAALFLMAARGRAWCAR